MNNRINIEDRTQQNVFMITPEYDNRCWEYVGDKQWSIINGVHTIKEIDGNFYNNYGKDGELQFIASRKNSIIMKEGEIWTLGNYGEDFFEKLKDKESFQHMYSEYQNATDKKSYIIASKRFVETIVWVMGYLVEEGVVTPNNIPEFTPNQPHSADQYLFRAKRLDDGKWIYGSYVRGALLANSHRADHAIQKHGSIMSGTFFPEEINPHTLCQYRPALGAFDGDIVNGIYQPDNGLEEEFEGAVIFDDFDICVERDNPESPLIRAYLLDEVTSLGTNIYDTTTFLGRHATDAHGVILEVGDKLVCLDDTEGGDTSTESKPLVKGKQYIVESIIDDDDMTYPMIAIDDIGSVFPERFLKI